VWWCVGAGGLRPRWDAKTRQQLVHELFERWLEEQVAALLQGVPMAPVPWPGRSQEP